VALVVLKGEKTLTALVQQYDVHANQIATWQTQLTNGAAALFGNDASAVQSAPAGDMMWLHAKIMELALENEFLSGALGKASLLSARR
jgi:transposase